jgi:hypothetical protein
MTKFCPCGSGQQQEPQYDRYGIFLCYTCPKCRVRKMAAYRPDIATRYDCDEAVEPDE